MSRHIRHYLCLILVVAGLGCSTQPRPERHELIVTASVSLKDVFTDLGRQFEAAYPVTITFNFGGSNLLQRQIETGAPADVFASAAAAQMDALQAKRLILANTRTDFAANAVVLVAPVAGPFTSGSFHDLAASRVRIIAIGSPEVPVRIYSEEVLRHLKLWDIVEPKLVFGQNVRQVLAYVARGEVDAGLVYATDASVHPDVRVLDVADRAWHRDIVYPAAVIADSRQPALAEQFVSFLVSETGQKIIGRYGFRTDF